MFDLSKCRLNLVVSALALAVVAPAVGQRAASSDSYTDFQPYTDYQLYLEGQLAKTAQVYNSRSAGALLIMDDGLPAPLLIRLRETQVETINLMKVDEQADGSVHILPNPVLAAHGAFEIEGEGIRFKVDGIDAEMRRKPFLLGVQGAADIAEYDPEYARRATLYTPSKPTVAKLLGTRDDVKVVVLFGSWCPFCQQVLPRVMRIGEEIDGSSIDIEYYGLPQGKEMAADPQAKRFGVTSVPTGIVLRDGREIGRLSSDGWKYPEVTLQQILARSSS